MGFNFDFYFQNYNTYLRRLFLSKREEAEEDNLENVCSFECKALLDNDIDFAGKIKVKCNFAVLTICLIKSKIMYITRCNCMILI